MHKLLAIVFNVLVGFLRPAKKLYSWFDWISILKNAEAMRAKEYARMRVLTSVFVVLALFGFVFVSPASAAELTINWTDIGNVISGVADIMPSIGNVITSVVPILILLAVVGFVLGLFGGILDSITNAFRFLR